MKQDHLYLLTVCLILLLLAATGCQKRQDFPDTPDNSFVRLRGEWITSCVPDPISKKFQVQSYSFGAADFTLAKTVYVDTNCSTPEMTLRSSGRYQALRRIEQREAYPVDYMVTAVHVAYHTDTLATRAKTEEFSGTDAWLVDEFVEVTGEEADPSYGAGTQYFHKFEISYGLCTVQPDEIQCAEWGQDVGVPAQGITPQSRLLMPLGPTFVPRS